MATEEPHALLRYVTPSMQEIFSPLRKAVDFRRLWVAIMKEQARLGLAIPSEAIEKYESLAVSGAIDLEKIDALEKKIKHDVTANLRVFQEQAGFQYAHQGCTSRDITDNVELVQLRDALKVVQSKVGRAVMYFAAHAKNWSNLPILERTHNVPAQFSTLGRRFAMYGVPLIDDFYAIGDYARRIPFRGVLGPIATGIDQNDLLGSQERVLALSTSLMKKYGFSNQIVASGQIFPRSIETDGLARVVSATNHAANYAKMVRLCTGYETLTEGFDPERVGSSAMPHKMNPSRAERICSLAIAMRGYLAMLQEVAGDQWFAGDVSDSAARRLGVHDGFYTADGLFNTTLQILNDTTVFDGMFEREIEVYGPYLASTGILSALQHPPEGRTGVGREDAHDMVKTHAVGSIMNYRRGEDHTFLRELAADPRNVLSPAELETIVANAPKKMGLANYQTTVFITHAKIIENDHPYLNDVAPIKTV